MFRERNTRERVLLVIIIMNTNFAFFGTDNFSVGVLSELKKSGFLPALIVTTPDKPKGRGLKLTPPPVKLWAIENKIDFVQPEKLNNNFNLEIRNWKPARPAGGLEIGVVASYGKILPTATLKSFPRGLLNVHPSLLPKYRGASPIQSQILNDEKKIGVTTMLMDEKMDHGPLLAQREFSIFNFQFSNEIPIAKELSEKLAVEGGKLLMETIPKWLTGEIKPIPQDDSQATFCKKISKEDGLIDLSGNPRRNFLKIQAFAGWPGTYFFTDQHGKKTRIIIKDAKFENGQLIVNRVRPEGKKEIPFSQLFST
ncbi:MAG: methionyl-tRNA formyltransferase [Candidatus Taylorbacteria bacterium RIFCSPHIGHO2_02_FULL_44_36]|uniref:methionyl-tRNA formyltransferase n=1 Tax=Candidatus Taylorbacteria bacterium RIFCSPLOWO2_12_FULL_44_15c TaxID=1802333 RepID=A0A1G2P742_9BACT|nr:MAG: methionyl-tRNA formyltransferase [Candidatus Taylorbacteria bacterium RIFCSPHIGHO2_02_FULL_44_36]OHA39255.1 MAG: methionyl-tRNA formyltransferase [Candidatus Taylorbacteria bacterium RIFCSPLOWO2_02_FULL_44_35]OHA44130.1 MAG: methionyl-tRNA formyltransferase [Candidatus Taylorbacteria bacterium RIFCSPLOWO2_12_FULL_44_15c]